MIYNPKSIANFFIERADQADVKIRPLQVIKLVYIAHGYHLGITNQPLINEPPQAWEYGPIVVSLYNSLKIYGNDPIEQIITDFKNRHGSSRSPKEGPIVDFLDTIWEVYGSFSGAHLSTITHKPESPWARAWGKNGGRYEAGFDIPEEYITEYYANLMTKQKTVTVIEDYSI